jgi:hypothetical protein
MAFFWTPMADRLTDDEQWERLRPLMPPAEASSYWTAQT